MIHLRGDGGDVVIDVDRGVPCILYWGAALGEHVDLGDWRRATERPVVGGAADVVAPLSIVPEHAAGFTGRPGLAGHRRGGTAWAPRFHASGHHGSGDRLVMTATDDIAGLGLTVNLELDQALVVWAELTNDDADEIYLLDALSLVLGDRADAAAVRHGAERAEKEKYAEAFEICEYGRQPSSAELRKLFPFFPKQK